MWTPAETRNMYDPLTDAAYDAVKRTTAEQLVNGVERMIQAVKTRNAVPTADKDKTGSSNSAADDSYSFLSGSASAGSSSSATQLPSASFSSYSSSSNSAGSAPGIVGVKEESMDVDVAKCAEQPKAGGKLRKMPGLGIAPRLTRGLVSVCLVCTLRHGANHAVAKTKWRRWKNSKTPTFLCSLGHLKDHKEAAKRMRLGAEEPLVPMDTGDMMRV